jgi:hypothetical protein
LRKIKIKVPCDICLPCNSWDEGGGRKKRKGIIKKLLKTFCLLHASQGKWWNEEQEEAEGKKE